MTYCKHGVGPIAHCGQCDPIIEIKGVDGIVRPFRQTKPTGLITPNMFLTDVQRTWDAARVEMNNQSGSF